MTTSFPKSHKKKETVLILSLLYALLLNRDVYTILLVFNPSIELKSVLNYHKR